MDPTRWIGLSGETVCPRPSHEEEEAAVELIYSRLTEGKTPVPEGARPHVVYALGPPGAGKSTVSDLLVRYHSKIPLDEYVHFDGDALVEMLPFGPRIRQAPSIDGAPTDVGFAYGWDQCSQLYDKAFNRAIEKIVKQRYNIILQTHYPGTPVYAGDRGYNVTMLVVIVTEETALRRAVSRAFKLGRFIFPATEDNGWGWAYTVKHLWNRYYSDAPWIAFWADTVAIVVNEVDGVYPKASDFVLLDPHPNLKPPHTWRSVQEGIRREMSRAIAAAAKLSHA